MTTAPPLRRAPPRPAGAAPPLALAAPGAKRPPAGAGAGAPPGAPPPRRGPGRPPARPPAPDLPLVGLSEVPEDPANRLELVWGEPREFKTLFAFFKSMKMVNVHIRCAPDGLTFFGRDHNKLARVVAHVAGGHLNWFHCTGTYWLGLKRSDHVDHVFASIDASFGKLTICQAYDDPHRLHVVFKDFAMDKDCNYCLDLADLPADEDLVEAERGLSEAALAENYPVAFTLGDLSFKKMVRDALAHTPSITVEKLAGQPLQITYKRAGIEYFEVYRDPLKIHLAVHPDTEAEGVFRCPTHLAGIKALAGSMVADAVRILCPVEGDLLFRSAVQKKALVVSTFVTRSELGV